MKVYPHNLWYRQFQREIMPKLILASRMSLEDRNSILEHAKVIQDASNETNMIHQLMKAYKLNGNEGIALMTLCEALLRTPDKKTQDNLIKEKLTEADWSIISENSFYATVSGTILTKAQSFAEYNNMIKRLGWPTVRAAVKECVKMIREKIGPVAAFKTAIVIKRLPKTRSGKVLRGTMRKIADKEEYKIPATIDDPAILDEIKDSLMVAKIL